MVARSTRRRVCERPRPVYPMERRPSVSRSKAGGLEMALFEKNFANFARIFPEDRVIAIFVSRNPGSHPAFARLRRGERITR